MFPAECGEPNIGAIEQMGSNAAIRRRCQPKSYIATGNAAIVRLHHSRHNP